MRANRFRFPYRLNLIILASSLSLILSLSGCLTEEGGMDPPVIEILSDSDFSRYKLSGSGTKDDPYQIADISASNCYPAAIVIRNTAKFFSISNCEITRSYIGIDISNVASETVLICNNSINDMGMPNGATKYGIGIEKSSKALIKNNNISELDKGLFLSNSDECNVSNNIIMRNFRGMMLTSSNGCTIENNTFSYMSSSMSSGIECHLSSFNQIKHNGFYNNSGYAITISFDTNLNRIFSNAFIMNNQRDFSNVSQARDEGIDNFWYDVLTLQGNYWSDWAGSGEYIIEGNTDPVDPYPLSNPPIEIQN